LPHDFIELHTTGCAAPRLSDAFAERGITNKNQPRLAIPHHAGEFGGRLPRIERHADRSLGHKRQMESRPANGIGRKKGATVPGWTPELRMNRRTSWIWSSNSVPVTLTNRSREFREEPRGHPRASVGQESSQGNWA